MPNLNNPLSVGVHKMEEKIYIYRKNKIINEWFIISGFFRYTISIIKISSIKPKNTKDGEKGKLRFSKK